MADLVYHNALRAILAGEIDLDAGGDDIRVALLMTNTTADSDATAEVISDIGTLDECDDSSYARQALANEAVNQDDPNTRGEFDADDVDFGTMTGDASRQVQGFLLFKFVSDDDDSIPILWKDFVGPVTMDPTQFQILFNTEGILQLAQA